MENGLIYCVDDDSSVLALYQEVFAEVGDNITVEIFNSARKLLEVIDLGPNKVDVFFVDIMMPEMDGFTLLQEIKNRKLRTPVVVSTGGALKETAIKALNLGAFALIEKPLRFSELSHIVKKAIEYNRSLEAAHRLFFLQAQMIEKLETLRTSLDERLVAMENVVFEVSGSYGASDKKKLSDTLNSMRAERELTILIDKMKKEAVEINSFFDPKKIW